MRALIAAGEVGAAARVRTMLATEDVICDVTDLGRDSFLLSRLYDYDIILLDLTVADCEGYKLLRQLRAAGVGTPILILSGRGELDEKVKFLRFGADDFLTKPVDRRELVARILAIVRRSKGHCQSTIRTGKLAVNLDTRVVSVDDGAVRLTPKEYGILELLSLRKGSIRQGACFSVTFTAGWTSHNQKSLIFLSAACAKSLPGQPAAVTTSRLYGVAATCCVSRRQCRPQHQQRRARTSVHAATRRAKQPRSNAQSPDPAHRDPKLPGSPAGSSMSLVSAIARQVGRAPPQFDTALSPDVPRFRSKCSSRMPSPVMVARC